MTPTILAPNLLNEFTLLAGRLPVLGEAVSSLVIANQNLAAQRPGVDADLKRMTSTWTDTVLGSLEELPPSAWNSVASGLHAAGKLVSYRGETPNSASLTQDLYLAASGFSGHARENVHERRQLTSSELFFNDRAVADMVMTLQGWWSPGAFEPEVMDSLATVLAQVGLASGVNQWPLSGVFFPNLAGAVWVFFDGGDESMFQDAKLLKPSAYFGAAAGWRSGSLGSQERLLASVLDGNRIAITNAIARGLPEVDREDAVLRRLIDVLDEGTQNDWRRPEILAGMMKVFSGGTFDGVFGEHRFDASLPAFLQMAYAPLN